MNRLNPMSSAISRSKMSTGLVAGTLLALGSAAQAKPVAWQPLAEDASKNAAGKITPEVLRELRSNPAESKTILNKHRIEWCDTTQALAKDDPALARRIASDAAVGNCAIAGPPDTVAVRNANIPNARSPWVTIRVLTHLFANDDGSNPTATMEQAQGNLAQLNMDYAPGRIRFVSTGILTHRSTRFREPKDVDGEIVAMKAAYAQAPTRQLNVYVFEAKTGQPNLLGRGTFAFTAPALTPQGGFFCDNDAFGLGKRTATHEFGHCLGLWHPFHGVEEVGDDGCGGCRELVGRTPAEGDVTGDFCSDTQPTSRNFSCSDPVTDDPRTPEDETVDSCTHKPYTGTDFHNFMGYADDSCIDHFTPQQYGRMRAWILFKLKSWVVGTGPTDPPVIESTTPAGRVLSLATPITATFSHAMNKATVQAAFKITPAVRGTFTWSADSKVMTFKPSVPMTQGTDYSVQVLGSARSAANKPLDGNYNGRADAPTVDAVTWGFRTAGGPSNDNFARAQVLPTIRGMVEGSNIEATKERGEPNHYSRGGASVWYRWTAQQTGLAAFTTDGSGFDTTMAAYQGTTVAALTKLTSNDDISNSNLGSAVGFHAEAGRTYYIAVDGVVNDNGSVAQGHIVLNWGVNLAPSNDLFANAAPIGGVSGSTGGNNAGAWSEPGEPSHAYNTPNSSIWYRWTAPANGLATFDTEGSAFDTSIGVYTGGPVNSLTSIASDDDSGSGSLSSVTFTAVAGVTYSIAVNGSGTNESAEIGRGDAKLNWSMVVAPANDLFAQAQVLPANSGTVPGSNAGANVEQGEPDHNYSHNASIWYRFTPATSGYLVLSTEGSALDTVLAAYTGSNVAYLTRLAQNDDVASGTRWSRIAIDCVAGTPYSIAIDSSSSSERGATALNWMFYPAPPNDNYAQRALIEGGSGQVTGSNIGATAEPNEYSPASYSSAIGSVWFQWTAPADGVATFSTAGSNFDTDLGVYVQSSYGTNLSVVKADDNSGGNGTSALSFDATAGTTYFIVVESTNNYAQTTRGNYVLGWSLGQPSSGRGKAPQSTPSVRRSDAGPEARQPIRLAALAR